MLQREFLGFLVLGQPFANLNLVEFASAISTVLANLTSNDLVLMRSDRLAGDANLGSSGSCPRPLGHRGLLPLDVEEGDGAPLEQRKIQQLPPARIASRRRFSSRNAQCRCGFGMQEKSAQVG